VYRNFQEIVAKARQLGPYKVAVLSPEHPEVMRAIADGIKEGLIEPLLVGSGRAIRSVAREASLSLDHIEIVDQEDPQRAADLCLDSVIKGKTSFIIKGNILTTYLYRALIRATTRLAPGQSPSTFCIHQIQGLDKIFMITDPGVHIRPDLECKQKILDNSLGVMRRLGCNEPRVMVLAAPHMDGSMSVPAQEADELRRLARAGKWGKCDIYSAKNLSELFPDRIVRTENFPDIFLVPNIETGNILVKGIDHLGLGIRQPATVGAGIIVLTPSRSDGYELRLSNLALGMVLTAPGREDDVI
jgi:phosphate butyryltransferase